MDKTKSIKDMSDKELDEAIFRLRKESEVQSLVSDIKRKGGSGYMPYDYGQEISTEKPIGDLYHHGVLGMHWGVHRKRNSSIVKTPEGKYQTLDGKDVSPDYIRKRQLRSKSLEEMSDAELKSFNNRMQLEKSYKELTKAEISPGRKFITETLTNAGKEVAKNYTSKAMTAGIEALLKTAAKAKK